MFTFVLVSVHIFVSSPIWASRKFLKSIYGTVTRLQFSGKLLAGNRVAGCHGRGECSWQGVWRLQIALLQLSLEACKLALDLFVVVDGSRFRTLIWLNTLFHASPHGANKEFKPRLNFFLPDITRGSILNHAPHCPYAKTIKQALMMERICD